jgi:hypothetical protein
MSAKSSPLLDQFLEAVKPAVRLVVNHPVEIALGYIVLLVIGYLSTRRFAFKVVMDVHTRDSGRQGA